MPIAFILINVDSGSEADVARQLQKIPNVKNVYSVYGVYDVVAKVEAETLDALKQTITWKIRRLDKVRSTQTMMVME